MTLIQYTSIGGVAVAIASDTRQVMTGKLFGIDVKVRHEDSEEKSGRLSKYVVSGGGGLNRPMERLRELIVENAKDAQFLEDYVRAFELAIDSMRYETKYKSYINEPECFQYVVGGFNSNGSTGQAKFISGKGEKVTYYQNENGLLESTAIAPSEDEFEIFQEEFSKMQLPKKVKEYPEKIIEMFATNQLACFINDPESVSEKCVYTVIFRNPNTREFKWFEDTINLSQN